MTSMEAGHTSTVADLVRAYDVAVTEAERVDVEAALDMLGVHQLVIGRGDPVDPSRHHVVQALPPGPHRTPGSIIDVVRPGWVAAHGVIRPGDVRATTQEPG